MYVYCSYSLCIQYYTVLCESSHNKRRYYSILENVGKMATGVGEVEVGVGGDGREIGAHGAARLFTTPTSENDERSQELTTVISPEPVSEAQPGGGGGTHDFVICTSSFPLPVTSLPRCHSVPKTPSSTDPQTTPPPRRKSHPASMSEAKRTRQRDGGSVTAKLARCRIGEREGAEEVVEEVEERVDPAAHTNQGEPPNNVVVEEGKGDREPQPPPTQREEPAGQDEEPLNPPQTNQAQQQNAGDQQNPDQQQQPAAPGGGQEQPVEEQPENQDPPQLDDPPAAAADDPPDNAGQEQQQPIGERKPSAVKITGTLTQGDDGKVQYEGEAKGDFNRTKTTFSHEGHVTMETFND